jgi:hypothetical protein
MNGAQIFTIAQLEPHRRKMRKPGATILTAHA